MSENFPVAAAAAASVLLPPSLLQFFASIHRLTIYLKHEQKRTPEKREMEKGRKLEVEIAFSAAAAKLTCLFGAGFFFQEITAIFFTNCMGHTVAAMIIQYYLA